MSLDEITWAENEIRIRQLWASAQWGDEDNRLRELFKRTLSTCQQTWLKDAIEEVKLNFASHQPELKWFVAAYDRIREARRFKPSGAVVQVEKFWIDWTARDRFGNIGQFSADAPSEDVAKDAARTRCGVVRSRSQILHDFRPRADPVAKTLRDYSREEIRKAVGIARERGDIPLGQLDADIGRWSSTVSSTVLATLSRIETQAKGISDGKA